jgi:hypothetical protein
MDVLSHQLGVLICALALSVSWFMLCVALTTAVGGLNNLIKFIQHFIIS